MNYSAVKRLFDMAASLTVCVALLPLFILIAIAICMESPGAPIFTQARIGLYGRTFTIFKFRSMVNDASKTGSWYTEKNDPRITRVGHFLRAVSLDELPQLWNVLLGDMSLVGPRPEVPSRQSAYKPDDWEKRHRVRPGITGLAQVSGRSNLSDEEQLRFDLIYVDNWSLPGDIVIMFKTILVVLNQTGMN